jgi:hypothetical protein
LSWLKKELKGSFFCKNRLLYCTKTTKDCIMFIYGGFI